MKKRAYRIVLGETPRFNATNQELRRYIESVHGRCVMANAVLGGYEHKINVLEFQKKVLETEIKKLEDEKYPPMDKVKDLPEVAEEDLPFVTSEER